MAATVSGVVLGSAHAQGASDGTVGAPSVSLSITGAGAEDVTYTVGFTATDGIAKTGTITLVAAPGTLFTSNVSDYSLTDETTSSGSFAVTKAKVQTDESGLPVYNFGSNEGAAVSVTVPGAIGSGNALSLVVTGVTNPGPGSDTMSVSTSSDATPSTAPYTITTASSVSNPTATLAPAVAGATDATYTVGFTTSTTGAIPAGGTVTLVAPPGTLFPDDNLDYSLEDLSTSNGSSGFDASDVTVADPGAPVHAAGQWEGSALTLELLHAVAADATLLLTVTGVSNPAAGTHTLSVFTSSDTTSEATSSYTVASAGSVTDPAVSLSDPTSGATSEYTIAFTARDLVTAGGTITIVAPPGTDLPTATSDYALTDSTTSADGFSSASSVTSAEQGATATITLPHAIGASAVLSLAVSGVTNPGAGSYTLSVATSSDVEPATSGSYTITGSPASSTSVGSATLSTSSSAAGATGVTYTVDFTTATDLTTPTGEVDLAAPPGTVFGDCTIYGCTNGTGPSYTFTDLTTSGVIGRARSSATLAIAGGGSIASIAVPGDIAAGERVELVVTQMTNPLPGAGTLSVSTSSDRARVPVTDTTASPGSLSDVSLSTTSEEAGANGVTYTVDFTASPASGGLAGSRTTVTTTKSIDGGEVNLVAPAGTIFGSCPYGCGNSIGNATYSFTDLTTNSTIGDGTPYRVGTGSGGNYIAGGGSIVSVTVPAGVAPGERVQLDITKVTNPPAAGTLEVSTTSDTTPVPVSDPIMAPGSVSSAGIVVAPSTPDAAGASYTVQFSVPAGGGLAGGGPEGDDEYGAIDLLGPPGTVWPTTASLASNVITGTVDATGQGTDIGPIDDGAMVSYRVPGTVVIPPGSAVTLTIPGVTNPPSDVGDVEVSTSSDEVPVPVSASTLAPISGTVTYEGNPVDGSDVQICQTAGTCISTSTDDGAFAVGVPRTPATYTITALPPSDVDATEGTLGPLSLSGEAGLTGLTVALGAPPELKGGVTITAPGATYTSSSGTPVINWNDPFQVDFPASAFPMATTTLITQVVVSGITTKTGVDTQKDVCPGGPGADGTCLSVLAGTPVDIPALNPIHGSVTITAQYLQYSSPASSDSGQVAAFVAITPELQFVSGGPDQVLGVENDAIDPDVTVSVSKIIGPNATDFTVVTPKTIDTGTPDCDDQTLIENASGAVGSAVCQTQVHWAPSGKTATEHATAVVTVSVPPTATTPELSGETDDDGSDVVMSHAHLVAADGDPGVTSGTYTMLVPLFGCYLPLNPSCAGGSKPPRTTTTGAASGGSATTGGGYVDPSGTVQTETASGEVPLAGATVTLEQGPGSAGPFAPVPTGSAQMSPSNDHNPSSTNSEGQYGWDTLAGTYEVTATHAGCTSGSSAPATVPPPATDLDITLDCPTPPTRTTTTTALTLSSTDVLLGEPVAMFAAVSGNSPSGTVAFYSGTTELGSSPLGPGGNASLLVTDLGAGSDQITATYNGDGVNAPSTSTPTTVEVSSPTVGTATTVTTSLSGDAQTGATIAVPPDTAVTDAATLHGTHAATATGTVTYTVYSNSSCTAVVHSGSAESITTPGSLPASAPFTSTTPGTYYWRASYSGTGPNAASSSTCGGTTAEVETVTTPPPTKEPTTIATKLAGDGMTGTSITVPTGTSVSDSATLSGANAATASGTVTYTVYSNSSCTAVVHSGSAESITTPGSLPASAPFTSTTPGTYFWRVSYSGDTTNDSSTSTCGGTTAEVETVTTHVTGTAPKITSTPTAYFAVGRRTSFTVTTTGTPAASLILAGRLPLGLSFKTDKDGTATISGIPSLFAVGTSHVTLTATNGITPKATQRLTIVVGTPPVFVTPTTGIFVLGHAGAFVVGTLEYPAATLNLTAGKLPSGLHFKTDGWGLATIYGTPTTEGTTKVPITATNGLGTATETLTIDVDEAPIFTSTPKATFTPGRANSFTVTASGDPDPSITLVGILPRGVTFRTNRNGTATISGDSSASEKGAYRLKLIATNATGSPVVQTFTLTVT